MTIATNRFPSDKPVAYGAIRKDLKNGDLLVG